MEDKNKDTEEEADTLLGISVTNMEKAIIRMENRMVSDLKLPS